MKLNEPFYAIVKPNGEVAGDGECHLTANSREALEPELRPGLQFRWLCDVNQCDTFRIARVRLIEDQEDKP